MSPNNPLEPVLDVVAAMLPKEAPLRLRYATVTAVNPVRIQFDAETSPAPFTPETIAQVLVGDRVLVAHHGKAIATILGRLGGWPRKAVGSTLHSTGSGGFTTFDFPPGRFTLPPRITGSIASGSGDLAGATLRIRAISATQGQFFVRAADGSGYNGAAVNWTAVQMSPTSADG